MLDIAKIRHSVVLYTDTGEKIVLDRLVQSLTLEEHPRQLAQKVSLTLANHLSNGKRISDTVKLLSKLYVFANDQEVFRGIVWEWAPQDSLNEELDITAYDNLIYMQNSEDDQFYSAGMGSQTLAAGVLAPLGIPLDYKWLQITHDKKKYQAQKFSDMVLDVLEDVRKLKGGKYVVRGESGRMVVDYPGTNKDIYVFETTNSISTSTQLSVDGVVTKVLVYGRQNDDTRNAVEATVEGAMEFGLLQKVIYREQNQSIGEAKEEAQTLIKEKGKPIPKCTLKAPNVPFLRKGDKVKIDAGSLGGYYYIMGITHNATSGIMTVEVEAVEPEAAKSDGEKQAGGNFKKGDSVILNGPVYATSYGEGQGMTFSDYHSTITITVDPGRTCPYHVGTVGWAKPGSLTKE